mgnify:CR=1 FL=1
MPCGSSTGSYKAFDLRHGDVRYNAGGVRKILCDITDVISPALIALDVTDQRQLDRRMTELDGTVDKSRLGGNAIFGVSMAAARVAATAIIENTLRK